MRWPRLAGDIFTKLAVISSYSDRCDMYSASLACYIPEGVREDHRITRLYLSHEYTLLNYVTRVFRFNSGVKSKQNTKLSFFVRYH